MTQPEWDLIATQAVETWGRTADADRRLGFWHRRWGLVPYERMRLALKQLERQCDSWPGPSRMHAVLDGLEASDRSRVREPIRKQDTPLSATEWRELGERLGAAADESAAAGRPTARNVAQLCETYLENADRVAAGHPPLWPPPPWSGAFAAALEHAADPQPISRQLREKTSVSATGAAARVTP